LFVFKHLFRAFLQARPIKPLYNSSNLASPTASIPALPVSTTASTSTTVTQTSHVEPTTLPPVSTVVTSEVALSKSIASTSSGVSFLSSPVTIAAGMQPMLTYSVVGAPPKSTTLTVASNQFLPQNAGLAPVNGHYIYHSTPAHIMSGAIPIHPTAVYPVIPPKQLIRSDLKPQVQAAAIATLTNELEAVTINEKADLEHPSKPCLFHSLKSKGNQGEKTENKEVLLKGINTESA